MRYMYEWSNKNSAVYFNEKLNDFVWDIFGKKNLSIEWLILIYLSLKLYVYIVYLILLSLFINIKEFKNIFISNKKNNWFWKFYFERYF